MNSVGRRAPKIVINLPATEEGWCAPPSREASGPAASSQSSQPSVARPPPLPAPATAPHVPSIVSCAPKTSMPSLYGSLREATGSYERVPFEPFTPKSISHMQSMLDAAAVRCVRAYLQRQGETPLSVLVTSVDKSLRSSQWRKDWKASRWISSHATRGGFVLVPPTVGQSEPSVRLMARHAQRLIGATSEEPSDANSNKDSSARRHSRGPSRSRSCSCSSMSSWSCSDRSVSSLPSRSRSFPSRSRSLPSRSRSLPSRSRSRSSDRPQSQRRNSRRSRSSSRS